MLAARTAVGQWVCVTPEPQVSDDSEVYGVHDGIPDQFRRMASVILAVGNALLFPVNKEIRWLIADGIMALAVTSPFRSMPALTCSAALSRIFLARLGFARCELGKPSWPDVTGRQIMAIDDAGRPLNCDAQDSVVQLFNDDCSLLHNGCTPISLVHCFFLYREVSSCLRNRLSMLLNTAKNENKQNNLLHSITKAGFGV
jgi:hypothetical protein